MDLIDIDQVLDNLELREAADEKELYQQSNAIKYLNHTTPSADVVATCSNGQHSTLHNSGGSKSFVGVSQVFNSLDDYQKNVESLGINAQPKYDIECHLPIAANTTVNDVNGEYNDKGARDPNGSTIRKATISPQVVNADHLNLTNEEYEDEYATHDINKFTEQRSRLQNDEDDAITSESLTTSSSSTFSSGPSAGAASTTDERISPITPVEGIALAEEDETALLVGGSSYSLQDANPEQNTSPSNSEQAYDVTNDGNELVEDIASAETVDDLATCLSSISITNTTAFSQSILPCEPTVSSALNNILNQLNETTSASLYCQMKEDITSNKSKDRESEISRSVATASVSANKKDEMRIPQRPPVEGMVSTTPDSKIKLACIPGMVTANLAPIDNTIQQPITFGSTMDEISDTELDSMLQEMDIEADNEDAIQKPMSHSINGILESNRLPRVCTPPPTNFVNQNSDIIVESVHADIDSNAPDSLNADSFSQASTVEFSEIRTQGVAIPTTEGAQYMNAVASSYSSTESSTSSSLDEKALTNVGCEDNGQDDQGSQSRKQRPTTLDLPTLQANRYANAGQTPPGINVGETNDIMDQQLPKNGEFNETSCDNAETVANAPSSSNLIDEAAGYSDPHENLGRIPPIWVPDNMANACMQCHTKFTVIKRRHHCRACGKVLCSVCCSQKFKLEFLHEPESRICVQCYLILTQRQHMASGTVANAGASSHDGKGTNSTNAAPQMTPTRSPNPNNPMEYCSTIPPYRQVSAEASMQPPPSVIVPVGVLKKDASYSSNSSNSSSKQARKRKSVMFSDGIAPGSDLASMEQSQWSEAKHARRIHQQNATDKTGRSGNASSGNNKPPTPAKSETNSDATTIGLVASLFRGSIPPTAAAAAVNAANESCPNQKKNSQPVSNSPVKQQTQGDSSPFRLRRLPPAGSDEHGSFIPTDDGLLPPLFIAKDEHGSEFEYKDISNNFDLIERMQNETLRFAVARNFIVDVKLINLKCCMNRIVMNFTTHGMHYVGTDEIIILLEYDPPTKKEEMSELPIPKEIFEHLYEIYQEAEVGNPVTELSYTSPKGETFLGSREHGGFIYIRPTFQCLQEVILPENPYLIGVLIHRYEVPWAKIFPLRLMLRLGAQYRYYPCPHISTRKRDSVYAEIAQTIINFLADFRNYSFTLPNIRGMYIHMEDRKTSMLIPRNRQDDVMKAMNNASDHILAFGSNFSKTADGHLVCMQNVNDERSELYSYSTQAINIQGKPRKITGASFLVLNESLKRASGLSGKCSIVEDGLMVQILPTKMEEVRNALRNQKDVDIVCGPVDADAQHTEVVSIKWVDNDRDFNINVKSPIDDLAFDGIPSMRVHASFNYANAHYSIRLTDIYILKFEEWFNSTQTEMAATSSDITRISEQVARSTSLALVPFLDLLAASGNRKIGLRVTLHQESVCYEAGARGSKLPPLYMNALDNHLIPTLSNESAGIEEEIIVELIFYILNV